MGCREYLDWWLAMRCLDISHLYKNLSIKFLIISENMCQKHKDWIKTGDSLRDKYKE